MNLLNKIKEFFGKFREKLFVEEVHLPAGKVTDKDVRKGIIKERAVAKGELQRVKREKKELESKLKEEKEVNLKKGAKKRQKQKILDIINNGRHREYEGKYLVIGRGGRPIGRLISVIEYKGGTYVYVRLPDGQKTVYGSEGKSKRDVVYYYENIHEQLNVPFKWIDGYIIINFYKGDKWTIIPEQMIIK